MNDESEKKVSRPSLFSRIQEGIRTFYTEMKRNPSYRRAFWIPCIFLMGFSLILSVFLPFWTDPWQDYHEDDPESIRPKMAFKLAESDLRRRLAQAKSDSIYLIVDLVDSTASLCIKGVPVRECPITRYRMSRLILHGIQNGALLQWVDGPFTGEAVWSTIPKSILHVKTAPKDTIEAQKNFSEPRMPIERGDVYWVMRCDRHFRLDVFQNRRPRFLGIFSRLAVIRHAQLAFWIDQIGRLEGRRLPRHEVWVRIEVDREDARVLYRALPDRPQVLMRFPFPLR